MTVDSETLTLQFSTAAPPPGPFWRRIARGEWVDWSELIRKACHSPFSHVDMRMDDAGNLAGASNNPDAPIIVTTPPGAPDGVALRPPNYQKFAYRRNMVLKTPRANDIRAIWATQYGKKFDMTYMRSMLSTQFPDVRNWRLDDHWACAEGIVWSLETGQFWDERLPWPKARISPTDVLMIMLMDKRWVNRDTFWLPDPNLPDNSDR